jgi:aminopeptidase YwaD
MSRFVKFVCLVLVISSCSNQKKVTIAPDRTVDRLHQHIEFLSDDKLEGRRAGTAGEQLAMDYIAGQFLEIGLQGKG